MSDMRKRYPAIPKEFPDAKFALEPEPTPIEDQQIKVRAAAQFETTRDSISAEEYDSLSSEEQWKTLIQALRMNRRRLLRIPGVTAVDIGYKIVDGAFTDTLALRVHVERKLPDDSAKTVFRDHLFNFIAKSSSPPSPGHEYFKLKNYAVPTDVIEAEYKPVQLAEPPRPRMVFETPKEEANRRRRIDPLVGGISIGSPQVPVGTLGALVWDNTDGRVCILSNWHVLSGDLRAEAGNPCFQPGRFDQGRSSDVVARLKRWSFDCQTDAAIAELTGSRHYCAGEIVSMFQQISGVTDPYLGMIVLKSGRSTGFTWGFIDGLYFSSAIEYSNGLVQVFEEQIHIAPADPDVRISEAGDSGSVWVTESNGQGYLAVGLHFAGDLPRSAFGEYALANPMSVVAKSLDFSFRPRYLEIRDEDTAPPLSPSATQQAVTLQLGNGAQPISLVLNGLAGSGGQPVDDRMGGG